jgi:hypothetical protein
MEEWKRVKEGEVVVKYWIYEYDSWDGRILYEWGASDGSSSYVVFASAEEAERDARESLS